MVFFIGPAGSQGGLVKKIIGTPGSGRNQNQENEKTWQQCDFETLVFHLILLADAHTPAIPSLERQKSL